jgi:hypothetical protein
MTRIIQMLGDTMQSERSAAPVTGAKRGDRNGTHVTGTTRLAAVATAAGVLAFAGPATAAAPVVSPQKTANVRIAPITIPGTGVHKGDRLPKRARLVYRDVTLDSGQTARLTIRAPKGKRLRGLAPAGTDVGFTVRRPRDYRGHRVVRLKAFTANGVADPANGRIYALTR